MKTIPLTNSDKVVLVDDEDCPWLAEYRWNLSDDGHAIREFRAGNHRYKVYMHRVIMGLSRGGLDCDHRNRNPLDNQKQNLRLATKLQNSINRPQWSNKRGSRYKGVWPCPSSKKNPWRARTWSGGKLVNIGVFPTEEAAAAAYNEVSKKRYGEFACLNPV